MGCIDMASLGFRTALVTGASRGIGRAIAIALGKQKYQVIGTATTDEGVQSITDMLQEYEIPGGGIVMRVDSDESVTTALATIDAKKSWPDVLINNAGVTRDNLLLRMTESEWSEVVNTNLNSIYRLCKPCIRPMMKKRWGRIINISSVTAQAGNPGQANYTASKAGMIGFSKSLAKELGLRNITVNCITPGFIQTDMTADLTDEQRKALTAQIPLGRLGTPDDVSGLVCFLASDAAAYITGQTIAVNGGMYTN